MAPIHRQFIPNPQSRAASQRKQSQRELHQCQDVAECLEVCRLWMGGRSSETSKWCHSLSAFKAVSRNFLVSFASRTVERKHDGVLHLGASSRKRFEVHSQI